MCANALAFSVGFAGTAGLAICLGVVAVCGVGCATRSKGRRDEPAALSPKTVSQDKDFERLRRTVKPCSQLVVELFFSFNTRFMRVSFNTFQIPLTCLTPGAVVLLWISGDLSSEKWKKSTYKRQVAGRRTKHWYEGEIKMGSRHRGGYESLNSVRHVKKDCARERHVTRTGLLPGMRIKPLTIAETTSTRGVVYAG
jgi:hypothetical protein